MARRLAHIFGIPCLALSSAAFALGVGSIESNSTLNQPLNARIPLISSEPHEIDNLTVSLASPLAFQRAGVERPFHLSQLKFEVVTDAPQPYVKVTTEDPFKEPFLDFLVELNWSQGRLVREYTLLLDPPLYETNRTAAPSPAAQPARPAQRIESAARAGGGSAAVARPAPSGGSYTEMPDRPSEYGPVRPNDTLWEIAEEVRPSSDLSVQQTMLALLRANPDAFLNGDMNRLKRGAVLRVPPQSEIASISAAAARAEVSRQVALWRESQAQRQPVAEAAADKEPRLQVVAPPDDAEGGEDAPTSLLDRDLAATAENVSRLQRELSLTEESRVGLQAENEELRGQVDDLKEQLAALERMVNLQLANATPEESADNPPAALASADEAVVEQPESAENTIAETVEEEAAAEEAAEAPAEPPVATIETLEPTTVPAEVTAPVQPQQTDSKNFLSDWRNIGVLGGAALLVAALIMLLIRRRREAAEVAAMAAAEPEPAQGPEEAEIEGGAAPSELEQAEAEPEPEEEQPVMMPEDDPLSEADIYMAHGHYDQARQVIESAIEQEPDRTDLRLKLLEISALTVDRGVFEAQLVALHERAGEEHPDWQHALEFAREFTPEHPLVAGSVAEGVGDTAGYEAATAVDFGEAEQQVDGDVAYDDVEESSPASFESTPTQSPAEDLSLDFDLGEPVSSAASDQAETLAEEPAGDDAGLEFELDQALSDEPVLVEEQQAAKQEVGDLEFDLDGLDFAVDATAEPAGETTDAAALEEAFELPGLDDQDVGGDDALGALDEVSTKLDLARAYLDMGDGEGARDLLQEVVDEGNAEQRQEAESLLRDIA